VNLPAPLGPLVAAAAETVEVGAALHEGAAAVEGALEVAHPIGDA